MKLLMIAPQPFFEPRGTPISVHQRLHGLSALNYKVDLVTYHIGKDIDIAGVALHRIPTIPFIHDVMIGPSFKKVLLDLFVFLKAFWLLLTRRYDAVHAHEEAAFFGQLLCMIFRVPHIYDMHSSLAQQMAQSKFSKVRPLVALFDSLERWTIRNCDCLITIGADLEEKAFAIAPTVRHARIENLPVHAICETPAAAAVSAKRDELGLTERPIIVYTGTFESYQGLDLLMNAGKHVFAQRTDAVFVLVGGKPQQIANWQEWATQNDCADNILFIGTVTPAATLPYLEMATMLVSPRTQGLSIPLKIYTYLNAGRPIVATDILAHSQVLNCRNAYLVEPKAEAFANAILEVLNYPQQAQEVARRAQRDVGDQYSFNAYLKKLAWVFAPYNSSPAPAESTAAEIESNAHGTQPDAAPQWPLLMLNGAHEQADTMALRSCLITQANARVIQPTSGVQ